MLRGTFEGGGWWWVGRGIEDVSSRKLVEVQGGRCCRLLGRWWRELLVLAAAVAWGLRCLGLVDVDVVVAAAAATGIRRQG